MDGYHQVGHGQSHQDVLQDMDGFYDEESHQCEKHLCDINKLNTIMDCGVGSGACSISCYFSFSNIKLALNAATEYSSRDVHDISGFLIGTL